MVAPANWPTTRTYPKGTLKQVYNSGLVNTMTLGSTLASGSGWQLSKESPGPPYRTENNWTKYQTSLTPGRLRGTSHNGFWSFHFDVDLPILPTSVWPNEPNWAFYTTEVLGRLNPNKPLVDIPLFIFELKDFPRMLRDAVRFKNNKLVYSDIPGSVLSYNFGYGPLASDLIKLLGYGEAVENAIAHYKRVDVDKKASGTLDKNKILLRVNTGSYTTPYNQATQSWVQHLYHNRRVWYSAKLTPAYTLPNWDSPIARTRWALGLNASYETIWNAIPWSWLIDYFINMGDFLAAHRGGMPNGVSSITLMCEDTMEVDIRKIWGSGWNGTTELIAPKNNGHKKQRKVVANPTPHVTFTPSPAAGKGHILASLVLSKYLRKKGQ